MPARPTTDILHVVTLPSGGWDQALALRAVINGTPNANAPTHDFHHHTLAIGPAGTRAGLEALGVPVTHTLAPLDTRLPGQLDVPIIPSARRVAAWLGHLSATLPRPARLVVHAWSVDARDLMSRALGIAGLRATLLCTPLHPPRGPSDLASPITATLAPLAERWTINAHTPPTFAPPPAQSPTQQANLRAALRQQLGLKPTELGVLLLADPPAAGQARQFVSSVGMLHLADIPAHAIVHQDATDVHRAVRHSAAFSHPWDIFVTPRPLAAMLPAIDLAIWHGPDHPAPAGLLLAHAAAAAGIPVVAPSTALSRWLLDVPGLAATQLALLTHDSSLPALAGPMHILGRDKRDHDGQRCAAVGTQLARHAAALSAAHTPLAALCARLWTSAAQHDALRETPGTIASTVSSAAP